MKTAAVAESRANYERCGADGRHATESEMAIEQQREKQHVDWRHKTLRQSILWGDSQNSVE